MADKKKSRTMSDALFGGKGSYKGGPSYKKAMERRKRKEEIAQAKKEMADFYKNKDKPAKVKKDKPKKQKDSPTVKMKGVKLDRERGDSSKKLSTKTMTAEERKAAGRTKQSRRDLKPTVYDTAGVRSLPWSEGDDAWEKQMKRGNRGSGTDKLRGGIKIPAIAKEKPAFTEVERPPKTKIGDKRLMKAGGRIRMDGTARPR
jgi:hypothetical protein